MSSTKTVNTILIGSEILKVLASGVSRLEDIYLKVGLNKSTTHRMLKSLVQAGLAFQHPVARTYHVGPLLLQISSNAIAHHHVLIVSAMGELRRLEEISRETALLFIPVGDRRLVLKEVPSRQQISLSLGEGSTTPIVVGSAGRVLLSEYDDRALKQLLAVMDMRPIPSVPVVDEALLMRDIEDIRRKGYALSSGVMLAGTAGVSVPVEGYICPVALCLFGPKFRFEPLGVLSEIKESAHRISTKLKSLIGRTDETRSVDVSGRR
jgi:DNA-binding IclR family transcriptional regulator